MLKIIPFDERRDVIIPGAHDAAVQFAVEQWIQTAQEALAKRSRFAVALSGGSTPAAIYRRLTASPYRERVDWSKVLLFWSDERAVPPTDPESNYCAAMTSGFAHLPIPESQIFRMKAEQNIDLAAKDYERLIQKTLGTELFDLVMLGVGEDGHTASLFPHTDVLRPSRHLVAVAAPASKPTKRITLTFECINQSRSIVFYAFGSSKQTIIGQVLRAPAESPWPASRVGTPQNKALWILDESASKNLSQKY